MQTFDQPPLLFDKVAHKINRCVVSLLEQMKSNMTKRLIPLFLGLFIALSISSQSYDISGKLLSDQDEAVDFANVILYDGADSTMVKAEYSQADGSYLLSSIEKGSYYVRTTFLGLEDHFSAPFVLNSDKQMPDIIMTTMSNEFAEVNVTAKRPLLEMKPDKLIFNVEGSINASGNDGLELLRKSPGVIVDNNDNISLLGKSGVRIYIDGKPSQLGASDLANYLRNIQSSQIDAIEISTNPGAKYDAEGNAGIINIRLIKKENVGFNGSLSLNGSQGHRTRYNTSLTSNYRTESINTYGSVSYYDGENQSDLNFDREQFGLKLVQNGFNESDWQGYGYRLGMDYFLNEKNTLGFLINGSDNSNDWDSRSTTRMGRIGIADIDSLLIAQSMQSSSSNDNNFNLNYRYDDRKGTSFNVDLDYGLFSKEQSEYQPNMYTDPSQSLILNESINSTNSPTDIDIYTGKVDYETAGLGGAIGLGLKHAQVKTDNTFEFYNEIDGESILNTGRSNKFDYTENVSAAYVNYGRQMSKVGIQLGLRVERTDSEGDLKTFTSSGDENVKRDYTDFFPSLGMTYMLNQKNNFSFNYSRRLKRPDYQNLNPFKSQLDEITFQQGNPFLNPEYSHNVSLTHSFNYRFSTTLSYSRTDDLISRLIQTQDERASFIRFQNVATQNNYSINFSAPTGITDYWSSYMSLTGYITHNFGDLGERGNIDVTAKAFNIYSQQTFTLPHDIGIELSGWYNSPALWESNFKTDEMFSIDFGISKEIFDGRGKIKLAVGDIFDSSGWSGSTEFSDLLMVASGNWDSRRLKANFSYNFGNNKLKTRNRKTGLEDEKSRISSGQQ